MRHVVVLRALATLGGSAAVLAGCASAGAVHHSSGLAPGPAAHAAAGHAVAAADHSPPVASTPAGRVPRGRVVPAPHGGNIHQVVPAGKVVTRKPVGLHEVAHATRTVAIRVTSLRIVHAVGVGPGQISGPGLAATVKITNSGRSTLDLGNVVVNLAGAKGRPAVPVTGAPARPVRGTLRPGHSASGTYVFTVPVADRSHLHLSIAYAGAAPVVLFTGNAS